MRVEIRDSSASDLLFPIVGSEDCDNPSDGIALNELFSYEIINDDEDITVRIRRGDQNGPTIGLSAYSGEREHLYRRNVNTHFHTH